MGYIHECHAPSCSSSWSRLFGEATITKNQLLKSVKQLFHVTEQLIMDRPRLILKNLRGDRRLYYVTKRLRLRMPKPMSSPTRCSVWEVSVTNQSKPGRTRLNGIWKTRCLKDLNRIDGEPMEFEWKYSQDSLHSALSKRFKNL